MKVTRGDLTYCQCVAVLGAVLLAWQFVAYLMDRPEMGVVAALNAIACACCASVAIILGIVKRKAA